MRIGVLIYWHNRGDADYYVTFDTKVMCRKSLDFRAFFDFREREPLFSRG
jgi:hypothetical protein